MRHHPRTSMPRQFHAIDIRPRTVVAWLSGMAVNLVAFSLVLEVVRYGFGHDHVWGLLAPLEKLFNIDVEQNLPSLFSTTLLLTAAVLLALVTVLTTREQDPDRLKWLALCGGFVLLAIDENCSFHETLIEPMRGVMGSEAPGIFYLAWVVPALLGVAAVGVFFLGFIWRLPPWMRNLVVIAGSLYLGGAIGIEMLDGRYAKTHGEANLGYQLLMHLEEALEMAGSIVFIAALLSYLRERFPGMALQLADGKSAHHDSQDSQLAPGSRRAA